MLEDDSLIGRLVYCVGCNRDELIRFMHFFGWRVVDGDPICPHCDDTPDEWIASRREVYENETWE